MYIVMDAHFFLMCYMYNDNSNVTVDRYNGQNLKKTHIFQEMINQILRIYHGIYNNLPVAEDDIYVILPQFKYFSHTNLT